MYAHAQILQMCLMCTLHYMLVTLDIANSRYHKSIQHCTLTVNFQNLKNIATQKLIFKEGWQGTWTSSATGSQTGLKIKH